MAMQNNLVEVDRVVLRKLLTALDGYASSAPSDLRSETLDEYSTPAQEALDAFAGSAWETDWPAAMRAGWMDTI